jgi:nitrous oxidase accessory protein
MRASVACLFTFLLLAADAAAQQVTIRTSEELKQALGAAPPGGVIRLAPGDYQGNVSVSGRNGAPGKPIVIEGADPKNPPVFKGGTEALHFTSCSHIVIRNIALNGQGDNGINIDDGGTIGTAHHFLLENIAVSDTGPRGNHDNFKFSGL